ncbi:acetolactate synthase [Ammoniphilus oxalaticus]|uniref:Acetolactate synthase n=2 Tax=Ammoniphilus oxalaticus TaxID=66863 RepID=A0A419SLP6_9BACL|nr:thiamine pyrophosphate-binding protein [Ammoniphilus oxalaticus]RKD24935.1 acetolactate synthase [Ammoniphilus oxalaticus]
MKKRVYTILVEHFKQWGITHVFGIPGKSISPVMLELESFEIEYVLGRHESGCGFEAAGYALGKNTLGVVLGTSGPGGTNLLTAAAQAMEFNLPVLFITGHPSAVDTGKAMSQESSPFGADLVKMFEPVTRFSGRVERAESFRLFLQHAIEQAWTGERGPVHLCIPFDVLMEEVEPFHLSMPQVSPLVCSDYGQAISLLDQATNPILFIGKGGVIAEAFDEIQLMAEHWKIPVVTTPGGKGAFPTQHPLYLGGFGLGGSKIAIDYMRSGVDLMIVIGSKLCDMQLSGFGADMVPQQVLQFEHEITFTGKSILTPTEIILGDLKANLRGLLKKANASLGDYERLTAPPFHLNDSESDNTKLSAKRVMKLLRSMLPTDAILFGDAGSHSFYAVEHFDILEPGTFYLDEVFIAMGAAIGYSIGAKLALPDRDVVCITGDGCLMLQGTEISTAVNHEIATVFFVLNNGRLDMVEKGMSYNTGRSVGAVYKSPLHVTQFAESMGAEAYRCETEAELAAALHRSIGRTEGGPIVIEVIVDPEEIPPILTRLLSLD